MPWTVYNSDGKILQSAEVGNNSITNAKMADDAVGADELAANAVVNASIASGAAIDATKIADGSVTSAEFQYINTLSSNAQTQIALKAPIATPTFTTSITIGSATITEAELEILDGATVSTAELNLLDGVSGLVQADLTKLAAIDATAAEIDLLDALDRGSIVYGNSSGATTVLGQGSADTVLTSDGTDIAWQAPGGALQSTIVSGTQLASGILLYSHNDAPTATTITGAGFAPTAAIIFYANNADEYAGLGIADDADVDASLARGDLKWLIGDGLINMNNNGYNAMSGSLTSLDSNGCTLSWLKYGTGINTNFKILFLR